MGLVGLKLLMTASVCRFHPGCSSGGSSIAPAAAPQIRRAYPQAAVVNLVWPLEQLLAGLLTPQQALVYQQASIPGDGAVQHMCSM